MTLVTALALGVSACGGGDDSVAVGDYANDLCTALKGWSQDLRASQTELQQQAEPGASLESNRDALQQFADDALSATETLRDDIEDAGEPDIDSGGEVSGAFKEAVEDVRGQLEDARDEVGEIPAADAEDYRAAVDNFLTELRSTLEGIDEHFQDVDAPEFEKALDEASACQA